MGHKVGHWDIGAFEFGSSGGGDIVPPELLNASLTSSTSLVLNFSEVLNTNSAQNSSNYSISRWNKCFKCCINRYTSNADLRQHIYPGHTL